MALATRPLHLRPHDCDEGREWRGKPGLWRSLPRDLNVPQGTSYHNPTMACHCARRGSEPVSGLYPCRQAQEVYFQEKT